MAFKILTVDFLSENAPKNFVRSLKDTGFAIIKNHPISKSLLKKVYSDWTDFFNSKNKQDYLFHKKNQDGYFPYQSENAKGYQSKDLKEFFHIYPWGRYPYTIGDDTLEFYENIQYLGDELLEWIDYASPKHISKKFSIPLVDITGGLHDAIEVTKAAAGLEGKEVEIVEYPMPGNKYKEMAKILTTMRSKDYTDLLPEIIAEELEVLDIIPILLDDEIQMILPYHITIE